MHHQVESTLKCCEIMIKACCGMTVACQKEERERGKAGVCRGEIAYVATQQASELAAPAFPCTGMPVPLSLRTTRGIESGLFGSVSLRPP